MQLYIKAKLVQQLNNLSSMVANDVSLGTSNSGAAESNSKVIAQKALRGAIISNADLESATADVLDRLSAGGAAPDGIYGPITRDAVAIMQEYMQQNYREGNPGEVDGVIGRQTMGYLLGKIVLAAITGA
jgi:peptidoglycan hydrolase-like protein with peptidoglycan-binding domain